MVYVNSCDHRRNGGSFPCRVIFVASLLFPQRVRVEDALCSTETVSFDPLLKTNGISQGESEGLSLNKALMSTKTPMIDPFSSHSPTWPQVELMWLNYLTFTDMFVLQLPQRITDETFELIDMSRNLSSWWKCHHATSSLLNFVWSLSKESLTCDLFSLVY